MGAGVLGRLHPRYAFAIVVTLPTLRSTMRAKSSLTPVCVVAFSIVALEFLVVMLPVGVWEASRAVAAETCSKLVHT